ncbi:MAG: GH3 auxin-responsive promoter family protein [Candidatus Sifarchaeia archaeon]
MDEKLWAYAVFSTKTNVTSFGGITTLTIAFLRRMQNEYGPALMDYFRGTKYEPRLRESLQDDGTLDLTNLWPNAMMIGATGIDSEPYRAWLEKTLPNAVLWDNYAGSEGLYGTTLVPERGSGIQLLPQLNYFEFIPESEVDKEEPVAVPLSEVKKGARYEMVITNLFGWTRYRVGDMVTFVDTNPYSVARIGRKGRVVNLSGEKLSDAHVTKGIAAACTKTGAEIIDYTVVGHVEEGLGRYTIAAMFQKDVDTVEFINSFEEAVKSSNEEFRIVREMGALGATALVRMTQSHSEGFIAKNHIQAKSLPLTSDDSVLASCEST